MSKPEKDVQDTAVVVRPKQQALDLADTDKMKNFWELATRLSNAEALPKQYQGKPANVLVAILMSHRLGMDLVPFMQSSYPVNGKIGYEGKLITAIINNSGVFKGRLKYVLEGDTRETRSCYVWATDSDGEKIIGPKVSYQMAKENGWTEPKEQKIWENGQVVGKKMIPSKWDTITDMMLMYRSAKFFGTIHCSDLILGMPLQEELEEQGERVTTDITDSSVVSGAPTLLAPVKAVVVEAAATVIAPTPVVDPPKPAEPAKEAPKAPAEAPKKPVEAPKPPEQPKAQEKAPAAPPKSEKAPIKSDTAKKEEAKNRAQSYLDTDQKPEPAKPGLSAYVEKLQQKVKEAGLEVDVIPFLIEGPKMLRAGGKLEDISDANAKFCVDNWPKLLLKVAEFKAKAKK